MNARAAAALLALAPLAGAATRTAQEIAGPAAGPARGAFEAGRLALEAGDAAAAWRHLAHALAFEPRSEAVLAALLEAAAGDADARVLWTHAWYAARAGADGEARPDAATRKAMGGEERAAERLARLRAAAVLELDARAAERDARAARDPAQATLARWLRRAAHDLAQGVPALERAPAERSPVLGGDERWWPAVGAALERALERSLRGGRPGDAVRAARILAGLASQARFEDLQGPAPRGSERYARSAAEGLQRARSALAREQGEPWTLDQLEWLTREEGEAFTRAHASFARPGVALSPNGRYRIETDCGHETLLGVARTIEDHHARLAAWYGGDPFEGVQGIVRVVAEATGLEAEGAPFWWVGGFQAGHVTTVRLSAGTIEGLGRLLTHELTHRFDGARFPGQPAWLSEGKAVWTGAAYGHSSDEAFVAEHALLGTVDGAYVAGYGGLPKLRALITGELEDYRDNYVAGYALYLYLATFREAGRPLFAERLRAFMEHAGEGRKRPEAFFVAHFCDGAQGRPAELEAFAERFGEWLSGFHWRSPKPWARAYATEVPGGPAGGWVYDAPTWSASRVRAEPVYGEGQARLAGELLAELGEGPAALRALVWALAADGRSPDAEALLARVCEAEREPDAAWVLRQEFGAAAGPAPFAAGLPQTRALLAALAERSSQHVAGAPLAAAAFAADHDRLAGWIGAAPLATASGLPGRADLRHPFDAPARHAGHLGWEEDGLSGYEERRVANLWYAGEDGDLHVGRERPRSGTELFDRAAHQRHAFARTREWVAPGAWSLRARVRFTTSFVAGAVVVGHTRRDRGLRLEFQAGDFLYAVGEEDAEPSFDRVGWRLHGLRGRESALDGATLGGELVFERPRPTFELELVADGATLHVFLEGALRGSYHTADGAPIEGHVGFATSMGAMRVQAPLVQRLDRSRAILGAPAAAASTDVLLGLDLLRSRAAPFDRLANRRALGLAPSPNGALLLWIPVPWAERGEVPDLDAIVARALDSAAELALAVRRTGAPQPLVLALPRLVGEERLAALRERVAAELEPDFELLAHGFDGRAPDGLEDAPDDNQRWLLFVDPIGVVRVAGPFLAGAHGFDPRLDHWLAVFRDHGRPPRALPEPRRPELEGER